MQLEHLCLSLSPPVGRRYRATSLRSAIGSAILSGCGQNPGQIALFMARTIAPAPDSIVYIDEAALLRISGVARSTRRNWIKLGLIEDRADGRYYERDVIETVLVALIVKATKRLDDARRIWRSMRDDLLRAVGGSSNVEGLSLVLELRLLRGTVADSASQIGSAAKPFEPLVVIPMSQAVAESRDAFATFAAPPRAKPDHRRREATALPNAQPLRPAK